MTRMLFITHVETPESNEQSIRRVTVEYFANNGFTQDEMRQIARLQINEIWQANADDGARSIKRVS